MSKKLGIFGGSFDPPHVGHVTLCALTLALTEVDELLIVPCYEHALGKELTSFSHRLQMCRLAFRDLRRATVSDIEGTLGGVSYTLRTVEHLALLEPEAELLLVVGADAMRERASWHRFEEIERRAEIVTFGRTGVAYSGPTLPSPPEVSATAIRARLAEGRPVEGLVPRTVRRYITDEGLYTKRSRDHG